MHVAQIQILRCGKVDKEACVYTWEKTYKGLIVMGMVDAMYRDRSGFVHLCTKSSSFDQGEADINVSIRWRSANIFVFL